MSSLQRPVSAPGYFPGSQVGDQRRSLDRSSLQPDFRNFRELSLGGNEYQGVQIQIPGYELPQAHYYTSPIYQNMLQANINQTIYQETELRSNRSIQRAVNRNTMFDLNCRRIQHASHRNIYRSVGHLSRSRAPLSIEEANRLSSKSSSDLSEVGNPKDCAQVEGSPRCVDMKASAESPPHCSSAGSTTSIQDEDGECCAVTCFFSVVKYLCILGLGLLVGAAINSLIKCRYQDQENTRKYQFAH